MISTRHRQVLHPEGNQIHHLREGRQRMLIWGMDRKRYPYGAIYTGDQIQFKCNPSANRQALWADAEVRRVFHINIGDPERSKQSLMRFQDELGMTEAQLDNFAQKPYIVVMEVNGFQVKQTLPASVADNV